MLLLHGLVATADTFEPLVECFGGDLHAVALNVPGSSGQAAVPGGALSFPALADMVLECADRLALERPLLVGHSHGGAVALECATRLPTVLGGLVLLCPAHPFSGHERQLVRFYLSAPGRFIAHQVPVLPRWLLRLGVSVALGRESEAVGDRWQVYGRTLRQPGAVGNLLKLLASWQADMDRLAGVLDRSLQVPVLLLWGALDRVVPAETAEALRSRLLGADLVILPEAGHLPHEEHPAACARLIEAWATRVMGQSLSGGSW